MLKLERDVTNLLGNRLAGRFEKYKNDRKLLELQFMQDLRQFRGKYDPDVAKFIPKDRSQVYPRDSRVKLTGFVAKMMEMMFPVSDTNWEIVPTTLPSIPAEELQKILLGLEQKHAMKMAETGAVEPISSDEIEAAVRDFADSRAKNMSDLCKDQLEDIDYPELCKKALRSGGLYSYGIVKGPMVKFQRERYWKPEGGTYVPVEKQIARPVYDNRKVWDIYPDLGARSWYHQEGLFERLVVARHELYAMASRKEFFGDVITKYLKEHQQGNYKVQDFETDLREMNNTSQTTALDSNKYEIIIYYGFVSAHELAALGHPVPADKLHESYLVETWMLENEAIKFDGNPFGVAPHSKYHIFIYGEDEDSGVAGVSLMQDIRDSQMSICALSRMLMDNAGATAGPILEVNKDLLARGHDIGTIHAFKTIYREGFGPEAQAPAVRDIQINSHIPELRETIKMFRENLDTESLLPSWTMGQPEKLGEAFRTSNNMSMMTGGANIISKDITRSFDRFVSSLIQSLVDWNLEFSAKEHPEILGDFQVTAKGSRSLVAKEVRGQAIEQFMSTLDDEERALLRKIPTLIERMKARDLPHDRLLVNEAEAKEILANIAQSKAAEAEKMDAEQQAKVRNLMAKALKDEAMAQELMALLEPKLRKMVTDTNNTAGESGIRQTKEIMGMMETEDEEEMKGAMGGVNE